MKRVFAMSLILVLALSLFGNVALAQPASAGESTPVVIDFEEFRAVSLGGLGGDVEIEAFYQASWGVTFEGATSVSSTDGTLGALYPPHSGDAVVYDWPDDYSGTMTITFDSLVTMVGGYFTANTAITLTAYDDMDVQVDLDDSLNVANYVGAGMGLDPNHYLEVSCPDGIAKVVIEDSGNTYTLDDLTFTYLLTDRFSGGGQIRDEEGNKKKDWDKISFSGWVGTTTSGMEIGELTVIFHNVDDSYALDKTTFTTDGIVELESLSYTNVGGLPADPPESDYNKVVFRVNGTLLDKHGSEIAGDWDMVINARDTGEPAENDDIRFELYNGATLKYDSSIEFPTPHEARTKLAAGNMQIVAFG